jgi:hypothetical protein
MDEHGNRVVSSNNTCWFTNLDNSKRHEVLPLYKTYSPASYPKYDNFDAIEVSKTNEIPIDYEGLMGVPITFMNKYNPDQFSILGIDRVLVEEQTGRVSRFRIDGREIYARIVIKNKTL